jgi:hypothetical protein
MAHGNLKRGCSEKFPSPRHPAPPLRGTLERTAGHSSRSASASAASTSRLQEISACQDAPCGRYTQRNSVKLWNTAW